MEIKLANGALLSLIEDIRMIETLKRDSVSHNEPTWGDSREFNQTNSTLCPLS